MKKIIRRAVEYYDGEKTYTKITFVPDLNELISGKWNMYNINGTIKILRKRMHDIAAALNKNNVVCIFNGEKICF